MPAVAARQPIPSDRDRDQSEAGTDPQVLLAMTHPTMRALTSELLQRDGRCRVRAVTGRDHAVADAIDVEYPDLVVLDIARFPRGCTNALRRFPSERMIVIGPEPGTSYRAAALAAGAGAWVARERVGDDLLAEVWRLLGRPKPPHAGAGDDGSGPGSVRNGPHIVSASGTDGIAVGACDAGQRTPPTPEGT